MNFLTLLQPIGTTTSTGSGSKTGTAEGVAGFEQLMLGLLGPTALTQDGKIASPVDRANEALTTASGTAAATAAAIAASANQAKTTIAAAPPMTLVEAATATIGANIDAKATGAADPKSGQATVQSGAQAPARAEGAISQVLLQGGLAGGAPLPGSEAAAKATKVAAGEVAQATATAKAAIQQAATAAAIPVAAAQGEVKAAADAVPQVVKELAANAVRELAATTAKSSATAIGSAGNAANPNAVPPPVVADAKAGPAVSTLPVTPGEAAAGDPPKAPSQIAGTAEVANAKSTIQSAILHAPGAEAPRPAATSSRNANKGPGGTTTKSERPAGLPSHEAAIEQVRGGEVAAASARAQPKGGAAGGQGGAGFRGPVTFQAAGFDAAPVVNASAAALDVSTEIQSPTQTAARLGGPAFTPPAEQVAIQFGRALASGADHITIRLQPESLGRVDVQIELAKDGRLTAMFIADRPETLEMLQRDARTLERALNEAGLQADSDGLSFSLRRDDGEASGFAKQFNQSGTFNPGDGNGEFGADPAVARHAALNPDALLDIQV